jgi:peptidyl-prolyl cis-trans isomerase A (cyclophilin A)
MNPNRKSDNHYVFAALAILLFSPFTACSKQDAASTKPEQTTNSVSGTASKNAVMLDPSLAVEKAPDVYKVKFATSKGDFVVEVTRASAPLGADRFYNLVKIGYYDDTRFFRVVDGFMVQFGIHGDGSVNAKWREARIADDPAKLSNTRGMMTFATSGPNSRTVQVFINFVDANARLDAMGFSPFGKIIDGMSVVDSLYKGYGEGAPRGQGPDQGRLQAEGNAYLNRDFPKMDWVKEARIVQ